MSTAGDVAGRGTGYGGAELMNAAELLEQVRASFGLTQEELARRAGTSRPTLSAYEHGRKSPTVATFARLLSGRDGNWRHCRRCHSPSGRPRADGRHGSRTGCRDWT
jgi:DNA-binding XRE family transcriptional regulator